ncbi:MAG: biotin transporter BioY [Lachnospiraceae bacterium]|nr:biotin transporter BioY [Lachnospiraceae bacterium]
MKSRRVAYCGLFVALIIVGAFIKVPVPVVPFTLQFLFTMLAGLLLGPRLGALSVTIYMVLGLIGFPVFAEGGGPGYLLKPSFGYIIGFIIGCYLTGYIVEHLKTRSYAKIVLANLAGLGVVYLVGMVYYFVISNWVIHTPIGLWPLFLYCFLLAVPGDILLCFLGGGLAVRLIPVLRKLEA